MLLGTCVGFDRLESAAKLGYDYLESNLGHIKALGLRELTETKALLDGCGAKLEAANCFFPGEIHLAGEDADIEIIRDYTRRAFDNAAFLGVKTCVLGSGRSRSVPDGFDREKGARTALFGSARHRRRSAGARDKSCDRAAEQARNECVYDRAREHRHLPQARAKERICPRRYISHGHGKRGLRCARICGRKTDTYTLLEPYGEGHGERQVEASIPRRGRRLRLYAVCQRRKECGI